MKRPDEYARNLLRKARDDALIVKRAIDDLDFADWVVGFHAQQAVEKAVKAVLSCKEVEYPHTHSIERLLQLLMEFALPPPPDRRELARLSQFAGDIRYGARRDFEPAESIDRAWALECVERTLTWAEAVLGKNL